MEAGLQTCKPGYSRSGMCPLANVLMGVRDCVKEGQAWSCKEGTSTSCMTLVNLLELELVWLLCPYSEGVTDEARDQGQVSRFKTLRFPTRRSNVRCSRPKSAVSCGCGGGMSIPSNLVISTSLSSGEKQALSFAYQQESRVTCSPAQFRNTLHLL